MASTTRDRSRTINRFDLRPWKWRPGQSGNPYGVGIAGQAMAKVIRETSGSGAELAAFFFAVMRGQSIPLRDRARSQVPNLEQRMAAAQWLADRGWGKAKETIELSGEASPEERLALLRRLSEDERETVRAILMRAMAHESADESRDNSNAGAIPATANSAQLEPPVWPEQAPSQSPTT